MGWIIGAVVVLFIGWIVWEFNHALTEPTEPFTTEDTK